MPNFVLDITQSCNIALFEISSFAKEKLSMPGVLFHHNTATKDYFHDELIPWEHYIPVEADLSDLKEKFDWAKAHDDNAREISDSATELMKNMATKQYVKNSYQKYFVDSLDDVIASYQPADCQNSEKTIEELLGSLTLIGTCSGEDMHCNFERTH